jgi:hypothetical protein
MYIYKKLKTIILPTYEFAQNMKLKKQRFSPETLAIQLMHRQDGSLLQDKPTFELFLSEGDYLKSNYSFALAVEMKTQNILWHQKVKEVFGIAEVQLYESFLQRIHPAYAEMYLFWSECIFEACQKFPTLVTSGDYTYHLRLPLRQLDGRYNWYLQNSSGIQCKETGQLLSFLSIFNYNGGFYASDKTAFLPFIACRNQPPLYQLNRFQPIIHFDEVFMQFAGRLMCERHFFSPAETQILNSFINGKPIRPNEGLTKHTLHEHHKNILQKARKYFLYEPKDAKSFGIFLKEHHLWT